MYTSLLDVLKRKVFLFQIQKISLHNWSIWLDKNVFWGQFVWLSSLAQETHFPNKQSLRYSLVTSNTDCKKYHSAGLVAMSNIMTSTAEWNFSFYSITCLWAKFCAITYRKCFSGFYFVNLYCYLLQCILKTVQHCCQQLR